jgi:predicted component of type VI protein secretion system
MAVVLEWVETGQVFPLPLGRPVVIGRGRRADFQVADIHVMRRHCKALWDGCRVWVHDLDSVHGTFLNGGPSRGGIRIYGPKGSLVRLGDVLHLGDQRLRLATPSRVEAAWLARQGGLVEAMARQADESGDFGGLPVLADALEEAGCADADLLAHCRSGGGHLHGCWAVDLLLGRE